MTHCCIVGIRSYYKVYIETDGEEDRSEVLDVEEIIEQAKEKAKSRAHLNADWNFPIEDKDIQIAEYLYSF